jgi:hypothetical protein
MCRHSPRVENQKKMRLQNTINITEQEVIINAKQSIKKSLKKTAIITDSLNSLMAIEGNDDTNNPKTKTLRKQLDKEGENASGSPRKPKDSKTKGEVHATTKCEEENAKRNDQKIQSD